LQSYGEIFTQVGNLDAVDLPTAKLRWETAFAAFEAAVMANPNGDPTDLVFAANRAAYDYMKLGELQCELAARADAIISYLGFLDTLGYLTPGQSALLGVYETGPQLEQHPVDYRVITAPPDPNNPLAPPVAPGFEPPLVV
jgi:hypothetical protein